MENETEMYAKIREKIIITEIHLNRMRNREVKRLYLISTKQNTLKRSHSERKKHTRKKH